MKIWLQEETKTAEPFSAHPIPLPEDRDESSAQVFLSGIIDAAFNETLSKWV